MSALFANSFWGRLKWVNINRCSDTCIYLHMFMHEINNIRNLGLEKCLKAYIVYEPVSLYPHPTPTTTYQTSKKLERHIPFGSFVHPLVHHAYLVSNISRKAFQLET